MFLTDCNYCQPPSLTVNLSQDPLLIPEASQPFPSPYTLSLPPIPTFRCFHALSALTTHFLAFTISSNHLRTPEHVPEGPHTEIQPFTLFTYFPHVWMHNYLMSTFLEACTHFQGPTLVPEPLHPFLSLLPIFDHFCLFSTFIFRLDMQSSTVDHPQTPDCIPEHPHLFLEPIAFFQALLLSFLLIFNFFCIFSSFTPNSDMSSPTVNHPQPPECISKCPHLFLEPTVHF